MILKIITAFLSASLLIGSALALPPSLTPSSSLPPMARAYGETELVAAVDEADTRFADTRGFSPAGMPDVCTKVRYKSYWPKGVSRQNVDKHFFVFSGVFQGPNGFRHFARNFVYLANKQRNLKVAIHVVARRDACIEDRAGIEQAALAKKTDVAIDYYFHGSLLNGKTFAGFYAPIDPRIKFMAEFSLPQFINDIDQVIEREAAPVAQNKSKIFLGGQSMGGILSAIYSSWDFDGNPATTADAGYNRVNGFVALDTLIATDSAKVIGFDRLPEFLHPGIVDLNVNNYYRDVADLRAGRNAYYSRLPGVDPDTLMTFALMGMEADWAPHQESTLFKRMPISSSLKLYLDYNSAENITEFLFSKQPESLRLRLTNAAMLGLHFDENFSTLTVAHSSFGFIKNAKVRKKAFPLRPAIRALLPTISEVIGHYVPLTRSYGIVPAERYSNKLIDWANFDEVAQVGHEAFTDTRGGRLTGLTSEVSDLGLFSQALYQGDANFFGWYMSQRLVTDVRFFNVIPNGASTGIMAYHRDMIDKVRKLELIGTEGVDWPAAERWATALVPMAGYDHADVLTASFNTPARRPNAALEPLLDFMQGKGQF